MSNNSTTDSETSESRQRNSMSVPEQKIRSTTWLSNDSYIPPYTIIGGVCGIALTYLTNSPVFLLGIPLCGAFGMIRDINVRTKNNGIMNFIFKTACIYKCGIPVLIVGGIFVAAVWIKELN